MNLEIKLKYAIWLRRSSYFVSTATGGVDCSSKTEARFWNSGGFVRFQRDKSTDFLWHFSVTWFFRTHFSNSNIKEELVKTIPLHRNTKIRGEDMFQSFWKLQEINGPTKILRQSPQTALQPWQVPTLTLKALCKNNPTSIEFLNYHCTISQQTLPT